MNNQQRKTIRGIIHSIEIQIPKIEAIAELIFPIVEQEQKVDTKPFIEMLAPIVSEFETFESDVSDLFDEEQEKFDNLSDGLQESQRGQEIQAASESLAQALEYLVQAMQCLGTETDDIDDLADALADITDDVIREAIANLEEVL